MGRLIVIGIGEGHLGLAIRTQVIHDALLAHLRQAARKPVCQGDRQGHILGGLIGGIAEHQALITCTSGVIFLVIVLVIGAGFGGVIYAGADLLGLLTDGNIDTAGIAIKSHLRGGKANGL